MLRSAFCVLKNGNRILLQLRDNKRGIANPGKWALLGGRLEVDETPLQGIKRELKEEVDCPIYNLFYVDKIKIKNYQNKDETFFLFRGDVGREIKDINLFEGQRLEYFKFEDFTKLRFSELLKDFLLKNKEKFFYF